MENKNEDGKAVNAADAKELGREFAAFMGYDVRLMIGWSI